jgi:hypothetical protein
VLSAAARRQAFVWVQMHGEGSAGGGADDVNRLTVLLLGRTEAERAAICDSVRSLETSAAQCSTESHRALLLEMIESGFKGLDEFDVALRELLSSALETAAAHESERVAAAAAAIERSVSSHLHRFQLPSCDAQGSCSWRSLSIRSMVSSGRSPDSPSRVTVGTSREQPARGRSAEVGSFDRRASFAYGARTGLPAMPAEPSLMPTHARRLRRASSGSGTGSVSVTGEGGIRALMNAQLLSAHARR